MKDCEACGADGFIKIDFEPQDCTACDGRGEIECYKGEHAEAAKWEEDRQEDTDYCFGDDRHGPYPGRDKNSRFYD